MARRCNGPNQDCDICTRSGDCNKYVECDVCGCELHEEFYEIDETHYCEECLKDEFLMNV